jgi:uncharacterized protein YjbI with pentapeptide repeats
MIEIKRWTDGKVLYVAENASDMREAVQEAVREKANLGYANLGYADLGYADLGYANLRSANLRSADLRSANLGSAKLGYANLGYAKLGYANLRSADLGYADLGYANLRSADLGYAKLGYAKLGYADLGYADLGYADLGYAKLGYADLSHRHPLWAFWVDFCTVLDAAPNEVAGLRLALVEGRVDGSTYIGECACLVGTIANVRCLNVNAIDLPKDGGRPAEQWFIPIRKGDCAITDPSKAESEGIFRASIAVGWIDEWLATRQLVGVALAKAAA